MVVRAACVVVVAGVLASAAWAQGTAGGAPAQAPAHSGEQAAELDPQVTEGVVHAAAAEVWKVFSTADGFKKMGPAQCDMDFRVGGLIRTHYNPKGVLGDEGTIQNQIIAYEPGRMVAIRISTPPKGFPFGEETWGKVWTVITLTDLGNRTHVRISGQGYPNTEEGAKMRDFFEKGNRWVVQYLQKQFDAGAPAPSGSAHAATQADAVAPIDVTQVVALPRAEAFALLSSSDGWKRALEVNTNIELTPGGKFEVLFSMDAPEGQRGSEGCTVLSYVDNEMLSFTWNAPPTFAHAREKHTWVVITFEELAPASTRIRLRHLGFDKQAASNPEHRAEWEQVRAYFMNAWPKVLGAVNAQTAAPVKSPG